MWISGLKWKLFIFLIIVGLLSGLLYEFLAPGTWYQYQLCKRGSIKGHSATFSYTTHDIQVSVTAERNVIYYMTGSASGQDEATESSEMIGYPSGQDRPVLPARDYPLCSRKSHIINALLIKLFWSKWLNIGLVLFFFGIFMYTSTSSRSIKTRKQKTWPILSHLDLTLDQ